LKDMAEESGLMVAGHSAPFTTETPQSSVALQFTQQKSVVTNDDQRR